MTNDYTILIRKLGEAGSDSYEARVREFPDLVIYAEDHAQAYEEIADLIHEIIEDLSKEGRSIPNTIMPNDDYSGRVTLRITKNLHYYLAQQSQNERVSLNQYVNTLLSFSAGYLESDNRWVSTPRDNPNHKNISRSTPRTITTNMKFNSNDMNKFSEIGKVAA
ncbi:toxin-antitoxin system HicB family antitoxin [Candidatus Spongiihabitans sp.]|uniref:toxin-antitoxin system HicB family antitoxin n=1 Tax=Candidatus Spongiihabitans sp. TaxID=3101308 RepID=UPI003C7CF10B